MQKYNVSSSVVIEAHGESDAIRIFRHHMACGDGKVQAEEDNTTELKQKVFIVQDISTEQTQEWDIDQVLEEINRGHSDLWTLYDYSDWEEGWDEWCEGDVYKLTLKGEGK